MTTLVLEHLQHADSASPDITIDSSGRIGIGEVNPAEKLEVSGNIKLDTGATQYIDFKSGTSGAKNYRIYNGVGWNSDALLVYNHSDDSTILTIEPGKLGINRGANSLTQALEVYGSAWISGNVGIGETSPTRKLQVNGAANDGTELFHINSSGDVADGGYHWMSTAIASSQTTNANIVHMIGKEPASKNAGYFGFHYAGDHSNNNFITLGGYAADQLLNIKMDGNVGIGTTNPGARLSFGDYIPSNGQTLHTYQSNNTVSGLGIVSGEHRMFTNDGSILSYGHVSVSDGSTYTERMKINSSGTLNVISSDVVLGGGAGSNTGSFTTAANSSTFKRFETDGAHFNPSVFSDPAIMGPNKLCVYDESTWKGGIGLGSGEMQYYTGNAQSFYKHTGSSLTKHMEITGDGEVTTPQQPHIFGTPHNGTEASSGTASTFQVLTSRGGLSFSNSRVTVPVAGVYMITYQTICQSNVGRHDTRVKINGVTRSSGLNENNGDGYHQRTHVFNMYLNASDYIQWENDRYYSNGSTFDNWTTASVTLLG